jgi:hypothetical protein
MRRLLARLLRAERALRTLPPRDPRQDLPPEVVARAEATLEAVGAEKWAPLPPGEADWFDATILPRLPSWVAYDARQARWTDRQREALHARRQRHAHIFMGFPPPDSIFTRAGRRALQRLGLLLPAVPA